MNERSIFLDALELTDPEERRKYLDQACGVDQALRRQVEQLLVSHSDASRFLEKPPEGLVATIAGIDETVGESLGGDSLEFLGPTNKPGCLGTLSQYEVVEVVGRGGMGIVLRAYDTKLNRVVAIKVMAPELAANAMAVRRFLREARAAAAVSHDHVVTIHAIEENNRPPFIVMEFVDGQSLQEKIDREGALELNEILRIGLQMARGLGAAHEQGLVHRDIKPANILLENGVERVKLTDFGLARAVDDVSVTQTGQIAGTPQFMSPEQAQGHAIDARSDLFSLGSVLYTMCTGWPPFRADSAVAMLRRVTDDDPRPICEVNSDIPDWLEDIILKLLAKGPAERFQSAAEVADLLSQHLAHLQHPTTAPLPPRIAQPKPGSPLHEQRRTADHPRGSTWRRRLWPAVGIGVLTLGFGFLLLGAIIHVVTDQGELIIEVDDPQIQVQITQDGREVKILKEGDYRITMLRSGQYNIQVLGASSDSFEISHERLNISRGVKKVVTIRRKPSREVGRLVEQFTEVRTFKGHTQFIRQVAFFHDGRRAVSTSTDTTLRIWEIETGRQLKAINTHRPLDGLAVSPDDKLVAVGVDEDPYVVELWNIESGEKVGTLNGHTARVVEVAFTPDGKRLMTSGYDWMVRIWDVESRHMMHQFATSQPAAAALSPDGKLVVTRKTDDRRMIRLWKTSGEVAGDFRTTEGLMLRSAFSSDSERLAAVAGGRVHVWDVANGEELLQINAHPGPVLDVWFTPDDRHLLTTGENDLTLRVWDAATGGMVAVAMANTWRFNNVAVSPDGSYVIAGGGANWNPGEDRWDTDGDFGVHLYRLPESVRPIEPPVLDEITEVTRLEGHTDIVGGLGFTPDGKSLVSGSQDVLYRWDLATEGVVREIPVDSPVKALVTLPDSQHVITSHEDGDIRMWNLSDGLAVRQFTGHTSEVHEIAISTDGKRLLSGGLDGLVRLWDVGSGRQLRSFKEPVCTALALSHDGRLAVHGGTSLVVQDLESGDALHTLKRESGSINAVAFSPDGRFVLAGDFFGKIEIWQVATGRQMGRLQAHDAAIKSLLYTPDGRYFVSSSFDQTMLLFDTISSRFIARAKCDDHSTIFLAMAPDGQSLASGGGFWLEPNDRSPWESVVHKDGEFPIRLWRLPGSIVQSETTTNTLGMTLRLIPAGEFEMGTAEEHVDALPAEDEWFFADFVPERRAAEMPRHKVTISKPFEMSAHEVTVGQFRHFIEAAGYETTAEQDGQGFGWRNGEWQEGAAFNWQNSGFEQTDEHPVCNVSWEDATEFCRWLSEQEGETYRLPTEAEWEYACRAGTTTRFWTGDDVDSLNRVANLADQSLREQHPSIAWAVDWDDGFPTTAPVGSFRPNAFGLQDMHGNVWEWCQDVYDDEWYETLPAVDPVRLVSGRHVFRGGGFDNWPGFLRSADRYSSHSETIFTDWAGFRVVREFPEGKLRNTTESALRQF